MGGRPLVVAVRRGDTESVVALLESGAVPDTVTDDGLPVLCLAVTAYDAAVAKALVEGGADPDRRLPDGTTPLRRAVDGGSPAMVEAVLGREPRLRLPEAERAYLLALARHWYEMGAENELRRRTRGLGPTCRAWVMDDEYARASQVTLDGLTVRDGHGAILTALEWAFRFLTPVDELVARAMARGDRDHVDRSAALWVLNERRSKQTWSALTAHRHSPDPEHRRFVLDVLHGHLLSPTSGRNSHEKETAELLVAWATEGEADSRVLADVLRVLSETEHRESPSVGLRYAGHPSPQVRAQVPDLLLGLGEGTPLRPLGAAARAALLVLARDKDRTVRARAARTLVVADDVSPGLTDAIVELLRDPEAEVRARTAEALANSTNRGTVVADALAALLDEEDFTMRLDAAYGLLRRDDPRTGKAIERLAPLSHPGFEHDPRLSALWRWKWNRDKRAASG
ncbi:HEAT repeat domain-containing protein [Streptomyces sp. NBC_01689]|uniref:HEAT repeat domain-containing protein n=1 Tax=Streptomyces sp. NBC_01689 TaxID=2975911 RepID=UPI002E300C31|nr:HEAT repeat domain-containing protein [Streptomyces sp. NBC_01689]